MDSVLVRSTLQAGILAGISNVAAQYITASKNNTPLQSPLDLDTTRIFQFVLYAVMVCPANFIWQRWLEVKFPAYDEKLYGSKKEEFIHGFATGSTTKTVEKPDAKNPTKKVAVKTPNELGARKQTQSLNWTNTFIKFAMESTFGTALNTVMFIVGFALIKGSEQDYIQAEVAEQFWPMFVATSKVWPVVNLINFSVVPLQHRMLVSQVVNLFWGIYLSLIADGPQKL